MSESSVREWAAALSAGDVELMVHGALRNGDMRAVVAAMRLLASKDPHRAWELLVVIETGLALAQAGPAGRADAAAELRAIAGTVDPVADNVLTQNI